MDNTGQFASVLPHAACPEKEVTSYLPIINNIMIIINSPASP
jgi:hypothetical protein